MRSAMRVGVGRPSGNSPRSMPDGDRLGEPVAHARVEARGGRPHLGVAHGAQPQLDPQDPVALQHARVRQELVDHRREPPDAAELVRRRPRPEAHVAGQLVRVLERLARAGRRGSRSGSGRARSRRRRPSRSRAIRDLVDAVAARCAPPRPRGCARGRRARSRPRTVTRRSARIRSANQAIAASRCESGPSSKPRVSRPACTFSTRSKSSLPTSVFSLLLTRCASARAQARRAGGGSRRPRRGRGTAHRGRCARSRPGRDRGRSWCSGRSSRSARRAGRRSPRPGIGATSRW